MPDGSLYEQDKAAWDSEANDESREKEENEEESAPTEGADLPNAEGGATTKHQNSAAAQAEPGKAGASSSRQLRSQGPVADEPWISTARV